MTDRPAPGYIPARGEAKFPDLTLHKQQLRQAQKMEAVGQLTGGIAHDFNNLMAIILGNIPYLDRKLEPDSQLRALTAPALRAVERGASLTQRLLAFSRTQSLVTETVDVEKLVAELGELLRRSLGEDVRIEIATSADLWRCQVDPGQLEQAVLNLANNARDAMADGGNLTIETSNETLTRDDPDQQLEAAPGAYVMISVTDDGEGMSPEVREKIFDPFYTTKEVGQGSGLGLSVVYGFIQQSGGHIRLDSEVGVGTTVRLYLPAVTQVDAPAPRAAEAALGPEPGARVLLVEDDEDLRAMTRIFLIDHGYQVLDASTGQEALKIFDENGGIDLLLSDVVLPGGLHGPDVAVEARRTRPDLKVVYMSGYAGDALERYRGIDPDPVLIQKPFDCDILGRRLRQVLDQG